MSRVWGWLRRLIRRAPPIVLADGAARAQTLHVIILDGTMSSLVPGRESHAGTLYQLLCEARTPDQPISIYYEQGIQWTDWADAFDVARGHGIEAQIERAYGALASRYREGDRVVFAGYSRGAYAVRSLAGMIDSVGLLRADHASQRNVRSAFREYKYGTNAQTFRARHCHETVTIEAVAVWDTVKALGLRVPILWRFAREEHMFHDAHLGPSIRHGFHALALNETRVAYAPVLWDTSGHDAHIEQVWFRGVHGDIGGHLNGHEAARPLANIPLVWMLGRLADCDVPLPHGWAARFEQDATAPSKGNWRGWAKLFWYRRARTVGRDPSERIHESVTQDQATRLSASRG